MLRFFSKKNIPQTLSEIKTDMHSHLIPGLDDGVRTLQESVELIREMHKLGYERIITTPHIRMEIYENNPQKIHDGLLLVKEQVAAENIPVILECAAEYFVDEAFIELMKKERLMTFGDNNYLLIEFSHFSPPLQYKTIIFELQSQGYRVILAHPERYSYFHSQTDRYLELIDRGVMFQLNLGSIAGFYDNKTMKIAEKLISNGLYTFIGTDMHNVNYLKSAKEALNNKLYAEIFDDCTIFNDDI